MCYCVFVTTVAFYTGCFEIPPPKWELCKSVQQPTLPNQSPNATKHLVVYLDTSLSMAGFLSSDAKSGFAVSADGNTIFSKTLLELRKAAIAIDPNMEVVVRQVNKNISPPSFGDFQLSEISQNKKVFNGTETNLAGAIRTFPQPLDKESADQAPPRFHILVSDGVQSSSKSDKQLSCADRSDPYCVKKAFLDLVNSGWGGAIIGMKSEFKGKVWSEISKLSFDYSTGKDSTKFRPFYVYIFSPDHAGVEDLLESLRRSLPQLGREDAYREYNLTSSYISGFPAVELPDEKPPADLLRVRKDNSKDMPRLEARASVSKTGMQKFTLNVQPQWSPNARQTGPLDELNKLVKWEIQSVYPEKDETGHRYPTLKLSGWKSENGKIEVTFETGWSPGEEGKQDWRMYRIVGTFDDAKNVPEWITNWSTNLDKTSDTANKTLNLESSVPDFKSNSVISKNLIAEFCVRVGAK